MQSTQSPDKHVVNGALSQLQFPALKDCFMLCSISTSPTNAGLSKAIYRFGNTHCMNALDALHLRSSVPKLSGPLPSQQMLENIYKAAFSAADHAVLKPWRFLVVTGGSREKLGDLFAKAGVAKDASLNQGAIEKLRGKPLRAPLVLVCISSYKPHPKVPEIEQDLSAGAATQNMLLAAFAQGLGAMWRTGSLAYDPTVKNGLGLSVEEKIVGFLYIGTINGGTKQLYEPDVQSYFQVW